MTTNVRELMEALDFHDSDCATHNAPAEPNGSCNCWIAEARELLSREWADSEDHERFFSRYGAAFLDAVDQVDNARATITACRQEIGEAEGPRQAALRDLEWVNGADAGYRIGYRDGSRPDGCPPEPGEQTLEGLTESRRRGALAVLRALPPAPASIHPQGEDHDGQ